MNTYTLGTLPPAEFDVFKAAAEDHWSVAVNYEFGGIVQIELHNIADYDEVAWFFDGFKLGRKFDEVRNQS
jgi:hypothetical protein